MDGLTQARQLARKLHALGGNNEIARKAAARELARRHPTDATELLQHLIELSREGFEPASCVLSSFVSALQLERDQIPFAEELKRIAQLQDLDPVVGLFTSGAPIKELDRGEAAKRDANQFNRSLGHLKQSARLTRNPDELSKLALASDPSIVRNALMNPRLTEALVVRIAARRPARPEPLVEVWKSPKWSTRHAVRRALAFNPYFPPEVAAKILPLLSSTDLEELAANTGMNPSLRLQARRLLQLAPGRRSGATVAPPAEETEPS